VFSSVYQLTAASADPDTRSELLTNVATLEQQLKAVIGAAKDYAVQAQFGKEDVRAETHRHLDECGEEFLATLEKLRPSVAKQAGKKKDPRASVTQAKSALDLAINDLSQLMSEPQQQARSGPSTPGGIVKKSSANRDTKGSQFYDALSDIVDTFNSEDL